MAVIDGLLAGEPRARAAEALLTVSKGAALGEAGLAALRAYDDAPLPSGLPLQLAVAELWQRGGGADRRLEDRLDLTRREGPGRAGVPAVRLHPGQPHCAERVCAPG
jgi:hypothetical protein